jgi:hypothetical protein
MTTEENNTFSVNFSRGEQVCEPAETFSNLGEAVAFAKREAASYKSHPDFVGGFFEVWEKGTLESKKHEAIFVSRQ